MRRPPDHEQLLRAARAFLDTEVESRIQRHGGVALAVGWRERGRPQVDVPNDLTLRLFVRPGTKGRQQAEEFRKIPLHDPVTGREFDAPTDVGEAQEGELHVRTAFDPTALQEPACGGVRIQGVPRGAKDTTIFARGTLGGYAWDRVTGRVVLLTNAHVLGYDASPDQIDVLQPFAGARHQRLGRGIRNDGFDEHAPQRDVDCAIASVEDLDRVSFDVRELGDAIMDTTLPQHEMRVVKYGAITRLRRGRIRNVHWYGSIRLTRDGKVVPVLVRDCFHVVSSGIWADHGDSGSLVLTTLSGGSRRPRRAVGLHFAGVPNLGTKSGLACRIDRVFETLQLTTLPRGAWLSVLRACDAAEEFGDAVWQRIRQAEGLLPLARLLDEHEATLTALHLRDPELLRTAAEALRPFCNAGTVGAALDRTIDARIRDAADTWLTRVARSSDNASLSEDCAAVRLWLREQLGQTLGSIAGVPVEVVPTVTGPDGPRVLAPAEVVRGYVGEHLAGLLERYGASAFEVEGRPLRIIAWVTGARDTPLDPLEIERPGAPPLRVPVIATAPTVAKRPTRKK